MRAQIVKFCAEADPYLDMPAVPQNI